MLFPMYTVSAERFLEMTRMVPHEELKAGDCRESASVSRIIRLPEFMAVVGWKEGGCLCAQAKGELVVFNESLGHASFVSHQWLASSHPDPEFKQMQVLQDAVRRLLSTDGFILLNVVTEGMVPTAKSIPFKQFRSRPLFFWYDYFSVPQLEERHSYDMQDGSAQALAISSIPAYVARCRYFLALCPTIECPLEGRVPNAASWASRGWTRLERAARELSEHETWILVQSSTYLQVVGTAFSFVSGPVGEGTFKLENDRAKLAPVMKAIVKQKLIASLKTGDLPAYRRNFNLQAVHFRGLDVEPISVIPDFESTGNVVADFLQQNALSSVGRRDSSGWWPLHYAALGGNVELIEGLLQQRADPNRRTLRDEPKLGFPPWVSALDLAIFYHHNDAAQRLIAARAEIRGGLLLPLNLAATADNAEGIRLLCAARCDAMAQDFMGANACDSACGYGARRALKALMKHGKPGLDGAAALSRALFLSVMQQGGRAELIQHLVERRADVNHRWDVYSDQRGLSRLLFAVNSLQYRLGRVTALSALAYHVHGQTPLMVALQAAQYEGAAALIALGARLDMTNCRGWKASDFVKGQSIPQFLQQGLAGKPSECERLYSLALPDGYVEVPF